MMCYAFKLSLRQYFIARYRSYDKTIYTILQFGALFGHHKVRITILVISRSKYCVLTGKCEVHIYLLVLEWATNALYSHISSTYQMAV
jgi:hypothetical protein